MSSEILTARNWYVWLWLSPLLTIPTLIFILLSINPGYQLICGGDYRDCDYNLAFQVSWVISIVASAAWHLVLIIPTLNKHSEFVRWHGRQAMLLAGMRTAIPLAVGFILYSRGGYIADELLLIPLMIAVWLGGTLWGQNQAARGDCALMRWTGHGAGLPLPTEMAKPAGGAPPAGEPVDPIAAYLNTIRFSHDLEQRREALAQLEKLGMVEKWGEGPELTRDTTLTAEEKVKAITPPRKKTGYRIWLIAAGIILLVILVVIDSSSCSPILRIKDVTYYQRAWECYLGQARYEKAITAYENGLKLDPDKQIHHVELADTYYHAGNKALDGEQYEQARTYFTWAIELNPNDANSHNNLAWTLAYHLDIDYELALEHALRSVELESDCHNQDTLGLVYYKLGRYEDALLAYSLALDLGDRVCVDSYKGRGDVYLAIDKEQLALADYRKYLALKSNASDREAVEEIIETLQ